MGISNCRQWVILIVVGRKMNNSKEGTEKPVLLTELLGLVDKCKQAYQQERVFNRALALVMAELFAFGRHTITQLLLTLGITDEDWSVWYRLFSHQRFNEEKTGAIMLGEMLSEVPETEPFIVGEDGFHVPRCSNTMPGYRLDTRFEYSQIYARYSTGTTICRRVMDNAYR